MSQFDFVLVMEGPMDLAAVEALFEGGCSDMTFQGDEHGGLALVHREAPVVIDAVLGAIRDIETASRLRVVEVENQEMVDLSDIAWRLGRTPESVRLLASGRRGPGGFPAPAVRRRRGQLWRWPEVAVWANEHLADVQLDPDEPARMAAINAALALRWRARRLPERERVELQELAAAG